MVKYLDPVIIQILWSRLVGITDEAATTLVRTAFSSVVREANDYSIAVFNLDGEMIAMNTRGTPGLFGGMVNILKLAMKEYPPESMTPGDIFLTNDPWLGSGHLNDITITAPFYYHEKLVGFGICTSHHIDIGGRMATIESKSIYEEGLQLPICKLINKGVIDETLIKIIRRNVRVPDIVIGDVRAQIAAVNTMSTRICNLLREHNLDDLTDLAKEIISRSEKEMRKNIEKIPNGIYSDKMYIEYKERTKEKQEEDRPIRIQVTIKIRGSDVVVDCEGTSPQVNKAMNVVYYFSRSYVLFAIKSIASPTIPNNEGSARPIFLKIPEGSVLNAKYPAPVWARAIVGHFLPELIFRALSKAIPDKIIAGSGSTPMWVQIMSGNRKYGAKEQFLVHHSFQGGIGAGALHDGYSCLAFPANISNSSMEVIETEATVVFNKKELYCDSAGAGKYRGGFGQEVSFTVISYVDGLAIDKQLPMIFAPRGGRFDYEVPGILGGLNASKGMMNLNGKSIRPGIEMMLYSGDTVIARSQGGGGYGNSLDRKPELVEKDVINGLISIEKAKELYGVIIDKTSGKVDFDATKAHRKAIEKIGK